jgi:capsular polysaccharide biosynthesis protein/cellulose biosynthesis protein BcsQ
VTKQMYPENKEPAEISTVAPLWQEGVNFDVIRSKLRHRWPTIIWSAALGAVLCAALAASYVFTRTSAYSASSQLLIANTTLQLSGPDAFVTQLPIENSLVQSEMELARSDTVLKRVINQFGAARVLGMLPKRSTPLTKIFRQTEQLESDSGMLGQTVLGALRASVNVSRVGATLIIAVSAKAATAEGAAQLTNEVVNSLVQDQAEANALITTSPWLRERIKVLGPSLRVISTATIPGQPDGQHPLVLLVLSTLAGMVLGTGLGIGFAVLDRRVVSAQQVAVVTPIECFGNVPEFGVQRSDWVAPEGTLHGNRRSMLNNVLRCARLAALQRAGSDILFIGITSCQGGEGKSTIAMKLAEMIAGEGRQVLLVDAADFAEGRAKGLTAVLRGELPVSEAIRRNVRPFLDVMPAGAGGSDIDDRWSRLPHILSELNQHIIIDLPAIEANSDLRSAVQAVSSILLVVGWGQTSEGRLRHSLQVLGPASEKLLGVVIYRAPKHVFNQNAFVNSIFGRYPASAAQIDKRQSTFVPRRLGRRLAWYPSLLRERNSSTSTEYTLDGDARGRRDTGR